MIKTITQIDYLEDVALVTINNIPNLTKNVSFILSEIASRGVTVDMICQTAVVIIAKSHDISSALKEIFNSSVNSNKVNSITILLTKHM